MNDATKKLKAINSMRAFAKAVGFFIVLATPILAIFTAIQSNSGASVPYVVAGGILTMLTICSVCLLADIASELVIRRMPKE